LKKKHIFNTDTYKWLSDKKKRTYFPNLTSTDRMNEILSDQREHIKRLEIERELSKQKINEGDEYRYFFTDEISEKDSSVLVMPILNHSRLVEHNKQKKLSVIVPYRDREDHLKIFLNYIPTYLESQGIDYLISIVEQEDGKPFNRGMLCNIGFLESSNYDYFCFHDVDLIPIESDYGYSIHASSSLGMAMHLAKSVEHLGYKPINGYFGGVTCLNKFAVKLSNGFSNNYWGWGVEDDDLFRRCYTNQNIMIVWRGGTYRSLKHNPNYESVSYDKNVNTFNKSIDSKLDGINQTKYQVISKESISKKITKIKVSI
jgi:hypothetical protein